MRKPPCYECTKRSVGCHAKCKDYKVWRHDKDLDNNTKKTYIEEAKKLDDARFKATINNQRFMRQRKGGGK